MKEPDVIEKATGEVDLSFVDHVVEENRWRRGAALTMLEELQEHWGWVPAAAVQRLADLTDWSPPYLYGIITFYDEFRIAPPGAISVAICNGSACALNREDAVMHAIERTLGIDEITDTSPYDLFTQNKFGYVTDDGKVVLRKADCIGACQLAPAIRVGKEIVGRLTAESTPSELRAALLEAEQSGEAEHASAGDQHLAGNAFRKGNLG